MKQVLQSDGKVTWQGFSILNVWSRFCYILHINWRFLTPPKHSINNLICGQSENVFTIKSSNVLVLSFWFYVREIKKIFTVAQQPPCGAGPPHYRGFTITLRHTTICRIHLDERSAIRSDLYLTTYNAHNRQTSMPPAGFERTIPASERPQTHALDSAVTGTGITNHEALRLIGNQ
jgi:hypothetical protein